VKKIQAIALIIFMLTASFVFSQEISEKKEIAIFHLSYYKWSIPDEILGGIDEEIKSVFVNLGRFNINSMSYQLDSEDVNSFIDKIKEIKEENVELPEEVKLGHEFFTAADLNRLVGSFIVVVPSVSYFNTERQEKELESGEMEITFETELKTSFSFINVEESTVFAQFFVETSGSDENAQASAQNAIDSIPTTLEFEITKVPEFQLKTGVVEVDNGKVIIQFGRNMGIKPGYEFVMTESRILDSGLSLDEETGLLIVKEVAEEVSIATIFYGKPQLGDQLKEVPRLGFDLSVYANLCIGLGEDAVNPFIMGIRGAASKGFYKFRPLFGVELPLMKDVPLENSSAMAYIGGEMKLYMRRLHISPSAGVGLGVSFSSLETEEPELSHFGGLLNLSIAYLFNKNAKIEINPGFAGWVGKEDYNDVIGLTFGAGACIKL
jgi:hypothetical protein